MYWDYEAMLRCSTNLPFFPYRIPSISPTLSPPLSLTLFLSVCFDWRRECVYGYVYVYTK